LIVTSVVALVASVGAASAQFPGVYVLHSKPEGGCPALDWHVVVGPNHELSWYHNVGQEMAITVSQREW
jgi:hypothetical protein